MKLATGLAAFLTAIGGTLLAADHSAPLTARAKPETKETAFSLPNGARAMLAIPTSRSRPCRSP